MLRRLLMASAGAIALAGSAFAADLPTRAPPPVYVPPAPLFTWTGFYLGGHIGYAWGSSNTTLNDNFGDFTSFSNKADGAVGGGHIGYNLQFSQFVVGLEGDVDGSAIRRSTYRNAVIDPAGFIGGPFVVPTGVQSNLGVQASIRGRVGYAWDRVLLYATGGVAFANVNTSVSTPFGYDSISNTRTGWTLGGGLEYAISNNWLIRAEYRYAQFGTSNIYANNSYVILGAIGAHGSRQINENRVNVGLSYKFDGFPFMSAPPPPPAPVVTK